MTGPRTSTFAAASLVAVAAATWSFADTPASAPASSAPAPVSPNGALTAAYDLPADGEVTAAVYTTDGQLIRTIVKSEFRRAGKQSEAWNGLDQYGGPVAAGTYTLKGLYHPHITTDPVISVGNPGNPPWPTPDGKGDWLSDEAPPQGAATDGKWVFLAAPGSEKGYSIMAVDENGQRQWGVQLSFNPCTVSLAVDGDYLYVLYSGPKTTERKHVFGHETTDAIGRAVLMCLDKKTGHAEQFSVKQPQLTVATWPYVDNILGLWDLRNKKAFSPDVYTGQPRYAANDLGEATSAIGVAATNGLVYVALHDENKIIVLKGDTAEKVDEIPVPKPAGLCARPDHSLLAVSDKQVVQIDPASKEVQNLVWNGLSAPRCVTVDSKGQIYVSDWGDSFQVKVFSKSGSLIRAIGKEGGRPWLGKWDGSGMILPTGMAVTDAGKLWVAEDDSSPFRISVWNVDTGALDRDYIGPTGYGGGCLVSDPKDSTIAYLDGVRFKLDYDKQTYTPLATIDRRMDEAQPFYHNGNNYNIGGHIVYHDGHEYMIFYDEKHIAISERKGDRFVTVAAMGGMERNGLSRDGTDWAIWDSDLGHRYVENYFPPFFAGHQGDNYTWTDLNGDGLVEENEMTWYPAVGRTDTLGDKQVNATNGWGNCVGDDWSIYWGGFCLDASVVYRIDIKGWTPDGAPMYDINDSKAIISAGPEMLPSSIFATHSGHIIVNYGYERSGKKNTFACFDRDGKSLWSQALLKEQGPKDIQFDSIGAEMNAPGIGPVLGAWAWHGNYLPYVFTEDGLYITSLLKISRLGPDACWDESIKTYFQDPQGVPYIVNGANDSDHIEKIGGLSGGRFEAPLTLTQADVDRATAQRAIPVEQPPPPPVVKMAWNPDAPKVDGDLSDWDMAAGAYLQGDQGRTAEIALARDDTNLYIAAQVSKDSPFSNKGDNFQDLFITGDCVDLMIGTDSKADPYRRACVPGDERVLFSMFQGKPIAVLYRPNVPGTKDPVQLMAAHIDSITRLDSATVVIKPSGNTYALEASVPLKDLGINPADTGSIHGDVGLVFSDETGSSRAQRLYFYNKDTKITADLTTEATLQPGEWGGIQLPIGKNIIKNSSFESPLADSPEEGWHLETETNGAHAQISDASPHSGQHALFLSQTDPVVFPDDAFNAPDFHVFIRAANGGAGGGKSVVSQSIPVEAGHSYSFRFAYRTQDLHQERQGVGPDRGYSRFGITVAWRDADDKGLGAINALDERRSIHDWSLLTNWIANYWSVNKPYLAPPGATHAVISISLDVLAPNNLPKNFIDDLELAEAVPDSAP